MRDVVKEIADRTGCTPEQVEHVAGLVLEALHEDCVKNAQGAGGILTSPAWMFAPKVCYHLNGILSEYLVGHPDERLLIHETMLRFRPGEWSQFEALVERWKSERGNTRQRLDRLS